MKFLLDAGISPRLGKLLENIGHTFRFAPMFYPPTISDTELIEIARKEDEIIITHDLDFGTILAFTGARNPSVIIFRIHQINPELFFNLIQAYWKEIEEPLYAGSIILIEQYAIRVRLLPI